jgi:uncharacterized protein (DUF2237 family)
MMVWICKQMSVNEDLKDAALNVLGTELEPCGLDPVTGFYRDGQCATGPQDQGRHTVCVRVTQEFLEYSKEQGNDLITPMPEYGFPGLRPGDRWCVCAARWKEAHEAGMAAPIMIRATHARTLKIVSLDVLKACAIDLS